MKRRKLSKSKDGSDGKEDSSSLMRPLLEDVVPRSRVRVVRGDVDEIDRRHIAERNRKIAEKIDRGKAEEYEKVKKMVMRILDRKTKQPKQDGADLSAAFSRPQQPQEPADVSDLFDWGLSAVTRTPVKEPGLPTTQIPIVTSCRLPLKLREQKATGCRPAALHGRLPMTSTPVIRPGLPTAKNPIVTSRRIPLKLREQKATGCRPAATLGRLPTVPEMGSDSSYSTTDDASGSHDAVQKWGHENFSWSLEL